MDIVCAEVVQDWTKGKVTWVMLGILMIVHIKLCDGYTAMAAGILVVQKAFVKDKII